MEIRHRSFRLTKASSATDGGLEKIRLAYLFRLSVGVGLQIQRRYAGNVRTSHGGAARYDCRCVAVVHCAANANSWCIQINAAPIVRVLPPHVILVAGCHSDDGRHPPRAQLASVCEVMLNKSARSGCVKPLQTASFVLLA